MKMGKQLHNATRVHSILIRRFGVSEQFAKYREGENVAPRLDVQKAQLLSPSRASLPDL